MELWKNDGRATRIVKMHPEVSRRGKPCSKIEAKLRSRRQSKLEIEEKKEAFRLKRTPKNSSSESEISPRFFTSKQHVELVNFQSPNIVPLFPKYSRNLHEIETKKSHENSSRNRSKNSDESLSKNHAKNSDESSSRNRSKNSLGRSSNEDGSISKLMEGKGSSIMGSQKIKDNALLSRREPSGIKKMDNKEFSKRRSRSAPCTPLFKIKCAKDKFPRDLIVDGKSLAANELREKMGNYGKNVPLSLRISRSGDVSVSSRERSSNERIIERSGSGEPEARPEEDVEVNELFLFVKKSKNFEVNTAYNNNINDTMYPVGDFAINECSEKGIIETEEEVINAEKIIGTEDKLIDAEERFIEAKSESTDVGKRIKDVGEKIIETKEDTIKTEEKNNKYEDEEKLSEETNDSPKNVQAFSKNLTTIENVTNTVANDENEFLEDTEAAEQIVKKNSPSTENLENKGQKIIAEEYSSPRKFPKKREFRWETILEKQYRRTDELICDAVNSVHSTSIIKNVEADKFKFWTEKAANNSKKNAPPKWRNSFEEKKLEAYRVIKQELPKLFMKRQISEAMKNKRVCEGPKNTGQGDTSNAHICKNAVIIPKPTKINVEFPKRMTKEDFRSRIMKFENLAENDAPQKNTTKENEGPKNSRPSILKRRKSPSPRRVTFRLPGRFIDDKAFEEKIDVTRKIVGEAIELDNYYEPVELLNEEIGQDEKVQNLRDKQKCGRHDGCNCCAQGRARKVQSNKLAMGNATKNLKNSPCIHTIEGQEDFRVFDDFEQDWETPTSEDINYASEDVKFPKETREAMKVLLRAKQSPRRDRYDRPIVRRAAGKISAGPRTPVPTETSGNESKSRLSEY